MINIGADEAYIEINITDYEFPDMGPDDYDSNWLEFNLNIKSDMSQKVRLRQVS